MGGRLAEAHVTRDDRLENGVGQVLANFVGHLLREVVVGEHGEERPFDFQVSVQVFLDFADGVEQLRHAVEGVVFALDRNQHALCGGEHVDGEQVQARGRVDDDEFEGLVQNFHDPLQTVLAAHGVHQFDFHDGKVRPRSDDLQEVEPRVHDGGLDVFVGDIVRIFGQLQHFVDVHLLGFVVAETLGRVPLGVHVDKESLFLQGGKTGSQVHGGSGLAHAAFLVAYRYHFTHSLPRVTKA